MGILFSSLFSWVSGRTDTLAPQKSQSKREKIRQTAADEHQARKERREAQEPELHTPQDRFLAGNYKLTYGIDFQSSNPKKPAVYQVWYEPKAQEIWVTFFEKGKPGPTYKYWNIDLAEATQMYRDSSKGIHVWDNFRIRGTKYGHQKSYMRV